MCPEDGIVGGKTVHLEAGVLGGLRGYEVRRGQIGNGGRVHHDIIALAQVHAAHLQAKIPGCDHDHPGPHPWIPRISVDQIDQALQGRARGDGDGPLGAALVGIDELAIYACGDVRILARKTGPARQKMILGQLADLNDVRAHWHLVVGRGREHGLVSAICGLHQERAHGVHALQAGAQVQQLGV